MTVIYVSAPHGGAGATLCTLRLGMALAARGERTLLVDGDADYGALLRSSGAYELAAYTLKDAEDGACRVKQALLNHPYSPNLYILPALGCKNAAFCEQAVKSLAPRFDVTLCDNAAQGACLKALAVCDPYPVSLEGAKKHTAALKDAGFKDVWILINKINGGLVFDGVSLTPREFASATMCTLCGAIPEDLTLPYGKIKSSTVKAFDYAADFILGGEKIYDPIKPYSGVKGVIKRKLRSFV